MATLRRYYLLIHRRFTVQYILMTLLFGTSVYVLHNIVFKDVYFGYIGEQLPADHLLIVIMSNLMFGVDVERYTGKKALTGCPEQKCFISGSPYMVKEANALLFPWLFTTPNKKIPEKLPWQTWVFMTMESPSTDLLLTKNVDSRTKNFRNLFDLIISYRKDSDIYMPYFTWNLTKTSSDKMSLRTKIRRKTKTAAWFVTNRHFVSSERDRIVKVLQENGVQVDVYGPGELDCPKEDYDKCMQMVDRDYKFYLSLENSVCKDYVTEKLFRTLEFDVVPIVLGGADYKSISPNHSYIDVSEFPSVSALARYIKKLDNDEELYMEYFKWKEGFQINLNRPSNYLFCHLCHKLSKGKPHKPYEDLKAYWYDDQCLYDGQKFNRKKINEKFGY